MTDEKLKKLLEQREILNARIRQQQNRENDKKRKADTRRKILAGAAVLDEASKHPAYGKELYSLLDRFLVRKDDRALFDLPPLPGKEDAKQGPSQKQNEAS